MPFSAMSLEHSSRGVQAGEQNSIICLQDLQHVRAKNCVVSPGFLPRRSLKLRFWPH